MLAAVTATTLLPAQDDWLPPSRPEPEEAAPAAIDRTLFAEAGYAWTWGSTSGMAPELVQGGGNLGLDGRLAARHSPCLHAILNGRLDWDRTGAGRRPQTTLTLREAYLNWLPTDAWTLDAGRMHVRDGVALGFNPTDPFRLDALLAMRTEDPERLKDSRLGVLALRAQRLEGGRGFALVLAPGLGAGAADPAWHDPRLAATNRMGRAYLKLMPGSFGALYANAILAASAQGGRLAGLNATRNLGGSATLYAETARLRRAPWEAGDGSWFSQAALGSTLATPWRQNITLEYRYNGAPPAGAALLPPAVRWQEPDSRQSILVHLGWDRFLWPRASLTALWQKDLSARGDSAWLELGCRRGRTQWSAGAGSAAAGPGGRRWAVTTSFRLYLD